MNGLQSFEDLWCSCKMLLQTVFNPTIHRDNETNPYNKLIRLLDLPHFLSHPNPKEIDSNIIKEILIENTSES